ncbi:glutaredoxin family protein [Congregibacter brevis]|uniref:Glutaredoxin family protein n=1 Tax=Congregibacter brevis TaxID=3081201 RepID=A0ABZ0IAZ3_9GAMM|nr:glutaredoxin family protein [Congregibacter sp. IMCC45268]
MLSSRTKVGRMMDEVSLILYSTEGCHLCEEAEALLRVVKGTLPLLSWQVVDIANDDALFQKYGWLIPVLSLPKASETDALCELRWPFDGPALVAFLNESGLAAQS